MNGYNEGTVDFITSQAYFLLNSVGLSPSQVALGFPASSSSAGSGFTSATVVANAMSCLKSGSGCGSFVPSSHYSVNGVMLWSINSDTAGFSSSLTALV